MSFLRPTLKDVARLSGVSEISVSRVMRDAPNISSELREKVEAAAEALHYTPNKIAGALASNTTDLIGVVIPTVKLTEYTKILSGIESVLGQSDYRMMLGITNFSIKHEAKVIRDFLAWSPSGIILAGVGYTDRTRQLIKRSKVQCVNIANDESHSMDYGLKISYENACVELVAHWQKLGVKNIAYVSTGEMSLLARGFKERLINQLDSVGMGLVYEMDTKEAPAITLGMKFCAELLQHTTTVDAVFFGDGDLAVGASFYCSLRSLDKIAIASFNNSSNLDSSQATIDLIDVNFEKIGSDAANFLAYSKQGTSPMLSKRANLHARFVRSQYWCK